MFDLDRGNKMPAQIPLRALILVGFSAALAAAFSASAFLSQAFGEPRFVGSLEGLSPVETWFDEAYIDDETVFETFNAAYVAEAGALFSLNPDYPEDLTPRELARQEEALKERLERALAKEFELVGETGAGVLVIRAYLTEIAPSRPSQAQLRERVGLDSLRSVSLGGAAVQIEVEDGGSGRVIAAIVDRDYRRNLDDGRIVGGAWSDARRAYGRWGTQLSRFLAEQ